MNESVVQLQPAFILQHRKYRETSLILDVFTLDFGVLSILAKGVRKKKSKTAGLLMPFAALKLSYVGRNELKVLTHVELDVSSINLQGLSLYSGFYINELIILLLHKHVSCPEVFVEYQQCMTMLSHSNNIEEILRLFEINLIELLGYGIELTYDIGSESKVQTEKKYYFRDENGMMESLDGYVSGRTLIAMESRNSLDKQALYESKQLMRRVIDFQLQGKTLKSRAVLAKILKQL